MTAWVIALGTGAGCPAEDAGGPDGNSGRPDGDAGRPDEDAGHSDEGPGHPDEVFGCPEKDAGCPEEDASRPDEPELLSVNYGRRYLGGGVSLRQEKFDWVMDKAESDSGCCFMLFRCLYKDEDLVNRSVTGQPSRRNLQYDAVKRKPITPAKVDAIKEINWCDLWHVRARMRSPDIAVAKGSLPQRFYARKSQENVSAAFTLFCCYFAGISYTTDA
ncbi:uncharacterized protein LOC120841654, partial [Ixodes scapularis]|uniref:uncharacterized protein LOC120841654 n=1 Tax=Ixodes scapularis TaxID=6945 RepID=UPI001C3853DE